MLCLENTCVIKRMAYIFKDSSHSLNPYHMVHCDTTMWNVVNIWLSDVRYFFLQDIGDVFMEDGH